MIELRWYNATALRELNYSRHSMEFRFLVPTHHSKLTPGLPNAPVKEQIKEFCCFADWFDFWNGVKHPKRKTNTFTNP